MAGMLQLQQGGNIPMKSPMLLQRQLLQYNACMLQLRQVQAGKSLGKYEKAL